MAEKKEFVGEEFKFPHEAEEQEEKSAPDGKDELSIELEGSEVDIEIVDDTPDADKGREPLPKEMVDELEKDEADDYSQRVKERMAQLKKVWHDERRAKEEAAREREEAIKYAQSIMEENKRLKSSLTTGEKEYVEVSKRAAEHELEVARRAYREAYDLGDTDKVIEAQQMLNSAQYKLNQVENYSPRYQNTLQEQENSVNIQSERSQAVRPDPKAAAWQEKNTWFGQDEEMTSLALGLHEKLVRSGVNPTSDEYYRRIDDTMHKRFPEYFEDDTLDEDPKPAQRTKPSTVVAPATRSTAPKKVHISKSAQAIAKKLGISAEQYAKEVYKLENR